MSNDEISGAGSGDNDGTSIGDVRAERDSPSWIGAVFDVLADRRRRHVLYYLVQEPDEAVERPELVTVIQDFEGKDAGTATGPSIKRDLHHEQLPKLADAGLIEYDTRQGSVRYTGSPGLEEWVEKARKQEEVEACSTGS